jgi:hypothetical protein
MSPSTNAADIVFVCAVCGKKHPALPPLVPDFSSEEIQKRKAAWLATEDKLDKSPGNEHYQRDALKAWLSYMATKSNGTPRLPATITTSGKRGKGFFFQCVEHEQVKEKDSQAQEQCGDGHDPCGHG